MDKAVVLPEIIAHFGQYLSRTDLLVCIRVCRSWKAELEPSLWRSFSWLHPKTMKGHHFRPTMGQVRHHAIHIRKLTIELDKGFSALFLVPKSSLLEELIFQPARSHPFLKPVNKKVDRMWRNYSSLIRNHPRLQKVVFKSNSLTIAKGFMEALQTCPNLRTVETAKCIFSTQSVTAYLKACSKGVVRICTEMDQFPPDFVFPEDLTFPALQHLDMRVLEGISITNQIAWISRCPNLVSVNWDPNSSIPSPQFCKAIPTSCPNLTELHLFINNKDADLATMLDAIPRIEKLTLSHSRFGKKSIEALERHFPTLRDINLQGCEEVKSAMVQKILTSCPNLLSISAETLKYEDVIRQPWVCKKLQMFDVGLCIETGDPRKRKQQEPETYLEPHRQVYERLSQQTELRYLSVCSSIVPYFGNFINLSLEAGMGQLKTLEKLKFFSCKLALFEAVNSDKGFECVEWMLQHWKRLEVLEGTVGMESDRRTKIMEMLKEHGIRFLQFALDDDEEDWEGDIYLDEILYDTLVDEVCIDGHTFPLYGGAYFDDDYNYGGYDEYSEGYNDDYVFDDYEGPGDDYGGGGIAFYEEYYSL